MIDKCNPMQDITRHPPKIGPVENGPLHPAGHAPKTDPKPHGRKLPAECDPIPHRHDGLAHPTGFILLGVFLTTFATHGKLAELPLRSLLRDELHLPAEAMASFFALGSIAWYLKPIAGILSDRVRLFGTRRRHYLALSALSASVLWGLLAMIPRTYASLIGTVMLISAAAVLANTVVSGILVDEAQKHGTPGRLSAARMLAANAAILAAGPVGGWLAERPFGLTCGAAAFLMMSLAAASWSVVRERARGTTAQTTAPPSPRHRLAPLFTRPLWSVVLFTFVFYGTPGFQSIIYYYQRDALALADFDIGVLNAVNAAFGILAAIVYVPSCRRLNGRALLTLGTILYAGSLAFYLFYHTKTSATFVEAANGFVGTLGLLSAQDLAVRAAPAGTEALGYAIILGIGNFANSLSDISGTRLAAHYGLSFSGTVWLSSITSLAPLLVIPLLPKDMLLQREGQ